MTPIELETLILNHYEPELLTAAFSQLTAPQRSALSTSLSGLITQISRRKPNKNASKALIAAIEADVHLYFNLKDTITLSAFAILPITQLKRLDLKIHDTIHAYFKKIISDRVPAWLNQWLDYDLKREKPVTPFHLIHHFMNKNLCQKPTDPGYIRHMVSELRFEASRYNGKSIYQQFHENPKIGDDIPKLFEVENTALYPEYQRSDRYQDWSHTLLRLVSEGFLSRRTLLKSSTSALSKDFKTMQISGTHKFHAQLLPTPFEAKKLENDYLILLSHPMEHVVGFALKMLCILEKAGTLNRERFFSEVPVVLLNPAKGNALSAIKLLENLIEEDAKPTIGLSACAEGFHHPHLDIQNRVMEILNAYKDRLDKDLIAILKDYAEDVSSAVKPKLHALLDETCCEKPTMSPPFQKKKNLQQLLLRLTPKQKRMFGLQKINMLTDTFDIMPTQLIPQSTSILKTAPPIEATVMEIISSFMMEGEDSSPMSTLLHPETITSPSAKKNSKRHRRFLDGLFESEHPLSGGDHLLLSLGLVSKDTDIRILSVDALIESVSTGRASSAPFGDTLVRLFQMGRLKLDLMGKNMKEALRVSVIHADFINEVIQIYLSNTDHRQRNIHHILEILLETRVQLQRPIFDETREVLKQYKGSSSASKTAKKILALSLDDSVTRQNIAVTIIQHRLGCAEKFNACLSPPKLLKNSKI